MNKILKLTSVSILSIMATASANAAGYTCEELIEYTSCNPGYTLSSPCPDGYEYGLWCYGDQAMDLTAINLNSIDIGNVDPEEYCYSLEGGGEGDNVFDYVLDYGWGCYHGKFDELDNRTDEDRFIESDGTMSCEECPSGSICAGGTTAAAPCPAGSYCAKTKLTEPTGQCAIGTYSTGGATECLSCPSLPLTDKDGNFVTTTTASTGTSSVDGCYINSNTYFADIKGIFHYTQNCSPFEGGNGFVYYEISDGETCSDGYEKALDSNHCIMVNSKDLCDRSGSGKWNPETNRCMCNEYWEVYDSGWSTITSEETIQCDPGA